MTQYTFGVKNEFKTKDLYEAAFLYASSQKLIRLDREQQHAWFVFSDYDNCQKLSQDFWSKEASVNAKNYAEAIRSLKDMIFAQK